MADDVQSQALAWDERLKRDRSAATRQAFAAWLAADPANRAEYAQFDKLNALLVARGEQSTRPAPAFRRLLWPALATATAALVLAIALLGSPFESRPGGPTLASPAAAQFTRPVRLQDGSLVVLGEGATVEADFAPGRRALVLRNGPARVLVAASPVGPLEVVAGRLRARVTAGAIDIDGAAGAVIALPGSVGVNVAPVGRPADATTVAAGERLELTTMAASPAPPPVRLRIIEADDLALADLLRLANVADETPSIAVAPAVGQRRVTGRFDVNDRRQLARRLAAALGLRLEDEGRQLRLVAD